MARKFLFYGALIIFMTVAPFVFPAFKTQLATIWLMIIVAMTWDMTGGQMGYNSLGNIFFFGVGMYASAICQVGLFYDVAAYTSHSGSIKATFPAEQYFPGIALGIIVAAVYALSLMQRAFQGPPNPSVSKLQDFGARELSVMLAMAAALVWLGFYPQDLLDLSQPVLTVLEVGSRG